MTIAAESITTVDGCLHDSYFMIFKKKSESNGWQQDSILGFLRKSLNQTAGNKILF
jgi:hypothetical protein